MQGVYTLKQPHSGRNQNHGRRKMSNSKNSQITFYEQHRKISPFT